MAQNNDSKDKELGLHLERLGINSIKEYQKWCQSNGFSTGLYKSESLRQKETQKIKEVKLQDAIKKNKERLKPLDSKLKESANKKDFIKDLIKNDNVFKSMQNDFSGSESEIPDFLDFISKISKKSKLTKDNLIVRALWKIFKQRENWIRLIENWEPNTKNIHKQFSQLVRHLFTNYKIPEFFDSIWFDNNSAYKDRTDWFLWIAKGNNIRKATNLPFELTKKMAHEFLSAPSNYDIYQALRYGQIMGLGGDLRLCQTVNETFLGRNLGRPNKEHSDFWTTVIMFFINNPMLDRNQFGPIIDYINHIKFGQNPQQPGFTIKGRNPQILLEQVEAWHKQLQKSRGKRFKEWKSCNFESFIKEEKSGDSLKKWEIIELLNSKELDQEGRSLRHCVGSYADSCVMRRCAIFSLRLDNERIGTIEVIPDSKRVVQVRGRFNALLGGKNWQIITEWAGNEGLNLSCSHN